MSHIATLPFLYDYSGVLRSPVEITTQSGPF
jgi:hypothetical protein